MQKVPEQVSVHGVCKVNRALNLYYCSINEVKSNTMHRVYKHRSADVCQPLGYRLAAAAAAECKHDVT